MTRISLCRDSQALSTRNSWTYATLKCVYFANWEYARLTGMGCAWGWCVDAYLPPLIILHALRLDLHHELPRLLAHLVVVLLCCSELSKYISCHKTGDDSSALSRGVSTMRLNRVRELRVHIGSDNSTPGRGAPTLRQTGNDSFAIKERSENSRVAIICLVYVDRESDFVERDILGYDVRDKAAASASTSWWDAVDGPRPGLEVYPGAHVGLDLRVQANHLPKMTSC